MTVDYFTSDVEHQGASRPRGADQRLVRPPLLARRHGVLGLPGQYGGDAGVADAGAARPLSRYVAGFGELEYRRVAVGPRGRQPGAGEGHLRAGSGRAGWLVRRRCVHAHDAWVDRRPGSEALGVDLARTESNAGERRRHVVHERLRTADVGTPVDR